MDCAFDSSKQFITFIFHFIRLESGLVVVRCNLCIFVLKIVVAAQWGPQIQKTHELITLEHFVFRTSFFYGGPWCFETSAGRPAV